MAFSASNGRAELRVLHRAPDAVASGFGMLGARGKHVPAGFDVAHLLALTHVEIEDRPAVETALGNLRRGIDFADALHHASGRACSGFLTFDAKGLAGKARRLALTPPVRLPG